MRLDGMKKNSSDALALAIIQAVRGGGIDATQGIGAATSAGALARTHKHVLNPEFLEYTKRFNLTEDDLSVVEEAGIKMVKVMTEIIKKSTTDQTKRIALGVLTVSMLQKSTQGNLGK